MFEEVITALREHAKIGGSDCSICRYDNACDRGYNTCSEEMAEKAADAIEELKRQLAEYHKYDTFLLAHGFFNEEEPPEEAKDDD